MRNVLVHDYLSIDMHRVIAALDRLEPVEQFMEIVARGLTPPATLK